VTNYHNPIGHRSVTSFVFAAMKQLHFVHRLSVVKPFVLRSSRLVLRVANSHCRHLSRRCIITSTEAWLMPIMF